MRWFSGGLRGGKRVGMLLPAVLSLALVAGATLASEPHAAEPGGSTYNYDQATAPTTPFTNVVRATPPSPDAGSHGLRLQTLAPASALAAEGVDRVIAETVASRGPLTSAHILSADQALTAGERWVGPGYRELGKPGSGVFRSADGLRQFRIDNGSLSGSHAPGVPHVHLEGFGPGAKRPYVNNHIPFTDR